MNGRNHAIVGTAAGVAVGIAALSVGSVETAVLSIPAAMIGAKLPDADHKSTKQGKFFAAFRAIIPAVAVASLFFYLYCILYKETKINPLIVLVPVALAIMLRDGTWFWGHRHGTHTLIFPIIFIVVYFCTKDTYPVLAGCLLGLDMGYLSHLIADTCTYEGCPLLFPVYKKNIKLTTIKSKEEKKCLAMAVVLSIIFIAFSFIVSF